MSDKVLLLEKVDKFINKFINKMLENEERLKQEQILTRDNKLSIKIEQARHTLFVLRKLRDELR